MKKILTFVLVLAGMLNIQGQATKLTKVNTVQQAEDFCKWNTDATVEYFYSINDSSAFALGLYKKQNGDVVDDSGYTFKVIENKEEAAFRVSYIYLDATQLTPAEIEDRKKIIFDRYNSGMAFTTLVKLYNMDGNDTGDTQWFYEGMMVKPFETAVKGHKKGELFTVYTAESNWHHVVLKTYDDILIKKVVVLKVKNNR